VRLARRLAFSPSARRKTPHPETDLDCLYLTSSDDGNARVRERILRMTKAAISAGGVRLDELLTDQVPVGVTRADIDS
jgi:hypothetical protein